MTAPPDDATPKKAPSPPSKPAPRPDNGDKNRTWTIGGANAVGLGSFHKTLPHDAFGLVDAAAFSALVTATLGNGTGFKTVPGGPAPFTNPQAGLAKDRLTAPPSSYAMPPASKVDSVSTGAEFVELAWMALLRDVPFNELERTATSAKAVTELHEKFGAALAAKEPGGLVVGKDIPKPVDPAASKKDAATAARNLFRLGLPGELEGPMLSQFFMRPAVYGTQEIDQTQTPYRTGQDYLTTFPAWLHAQNTGQDADGGDYGASNEAGAQNFEAEPRYISTMRDLARFVNKDALHQAYFNAALILLSGKALWTPGNPYRSQTREAGFGVLGGPHILALVSEVATRALKIVWNEKWQVHLRLRPEAYGGLLHVQTVGVNGQTRACGLPQTAINSIASQRILARYGSRLLPMAFSAGSPAHPAYGAGHATVAGACVTVLKAYFSMEESGELLKFGSLLERDRRVPYGPGAPIAMYETGRHGGKWERAPLAPDVADKLTIEGELNKLAQNVAMGRSMGGVHWRTDNTRSLVLGEAIAAKILADIVQDVNETTSFPPGVVFQFRTFARDASDKPKTVKIDKAGVHVNGTLIDINAPVSEL